MNGLYVDSIMVSVSLFALVAWIASCSDVHLYGQAEIALLWTVIMTGLSNPSQSSVLFDAAGQKSRFNSRFLRSSRFFGKVYRYAAIVWTTTVSDCAADRGSRKRRS